MESRAVVLRRKISRINFNFDIMHQRLRKEPPCHSRLCKGLFCQFEVSFNKRRGSGPLNDPLLCSHHQSAVSGLSDSQRAARIGRVELNLFSSSISSEMDVRKVDAGQTGGCVHYGVTHHVSDLVWIDLDLGSSLPMGCY